MYTRERMREYMRARRAEWREKGLCVDCGAERESKYLRCNACREKARIRMEQKRKKHKEVGHGG